MTHSSGNYFEKRRQSQEGLMRSPQTSGADVLPEVTMPSNAAAAQQADANSNLLEQFKDILTFFQAHKREIEEIKEIKNTLAEIKLQPLHASTSDAKHQKQ